MSAASPAYLGADPGAGGALALFVPDAMAGGGTMYIVDMPKLEKGLDYWRLAAYLNHWADAYDIKAVVIERVSAMPNQGVVSMFSFGQAFGALKQAVASAGLNFTLVQPAVWKRAYGLQGGRENKAASAAKAIAMFPGLTTMLYGPKGGVKDGRAEAALLAHYGSKLK